jgi:hypothetical protein
VQALRTPVVATIWELALGGRSNSGGLIDFSAHPSSRDESMQR